MADDSKDIPKSIADEIGESVFETVQTPVEIFFLGLFVFGVLSIAATTLVGPCGNVDDTKTYPDPRTIDYIPGATVVTTRAITLGETVITAGTCGIVDGVDREAETARVHILAKAQPFFVETADAYRPLSAFSALFEYPVSTLLFLHTGTPTGDVSLGAITPVETQQYTNWFRNFYLNTVYLILAVLALLILILGYIGYRFEKKRKVWYERHTLRATYISRLMRDKQKTRELQENWEKVTALQETQSVENWKETVNLLEETLGGVLTLLRFDGETTREKLESMKEEDLWNIDELWKAHSLVMRMRGFGGGGDAVPDGGDGTEPAARGESVVSDGTQHGGSPSAHTEGEDAAASGTAATASGAGSATADDAGTTADTAAPASDTAPPHEAFPPVTEKTVGKIVGIYKTSFIWLGLLPHWA